MHQFQALGHSPCSSISFHSKKAFNKCPASINIRDHIDEQGLNFRGNASKPQKVFEVSSLAANGPLPCVSVEGIPRPSEQLDIGKTPGSEVELRKRERASVWEAVCSYILALDATVKITMLIFIPCCVAIRLIYGIEVMKELTPLWIIGPLIVAFDIKMFQVISQLYVFSFKQAENAIRSIPSPKKLAEVTYTYILQKLVEVKSLDYKKAAKLKFKEFMQWNENMSVFFSNLSWPLYWRIVRFLTRANLI